MVFMSLRIGLAQITPSLADVGANLALHLSVIAEAIEQSVDLLIFPELSLTGYFLGERAFDVAVRTRRDDPIFGRLLAASEQLDLVVSFVERDERGRYYIAAAYLSGGEIIHLHRKVYLPTYGMFEEGRYFAHGDRARAFDTRFGRLGLLICEDFWHASLPYLLWQDGADVLLLISASVEHGLGNAPETATAGRVDTILKAYAILFTTFVVHVNRTGLEGDNCFWGGSTVFSPEGARLAQGPFGEAQLVIAELNLDDLQPARQRLPLLRDERADLTLRELERILRL